MTFLKLHLHSFYKLIKTNYLHKHTLKHNKLLKEKKKRDIEDHTRYITTLRFTDFAFVVLSTSTLNTSLKIADGGFAFNVIWKVIPLDAVSKTKLSFPYLVVLV